MEAGTWAQTDNSPIAMQSIICYLRAISANFNFKGKVRLLISFLAFKLNKWVCVVAFSFWGFKPNPIFLARASNLDIIPIVEGGPLL